MLPRQVLIQHLPLLSGQLLLLPEQLIVHSDPAPGQSGLLVPLLPDPFLLCDLLSGLRYLALVFSSHPHSSRHPIPRRLPACLNPDSLPVGRRQIQKQNVQ